MTSNFKVKIDGVLIKNPYSYDLDLNYISDAERVLNTDMIIDGIGGKIKLILYYDRIKLEDLKPILGMTWNEFLRNKQKIKQTVSIQFWDEPEITFNSYIAPQRLHGDNESAIRREFKDFKLEFTETTGETFIFD